MRITNRNLGLKIQIDWNNDADKALYNRLRDLGWMAAHYRNQQSVAKLAQLRGWRVDPEAADKNDISKQIRRSEKGDLSGDAYSAAEQEVQATWTRDGKKILAGQPVPMWRPNAALSVTGKAKQQDSGILLVERDGQFILRLRIQSKESPSGSWLELPIVRNTKRDEWQGPVLNAMLTWDIPIKKATVHLENHGITVRLSYPLELPDLPPMGKRIATLGPVSPEGRLRLYADRHIAQDYTSKLAHIRARKDDWNFVVRRAKAQIGRRHGHARLKRKRIASLNFKGWLHDYVHQWTRQIVDWCKGQGIGALQVGNLETLDWPAYEFRQQLQYKAEEAGIKVQELAVLNQAAERSIKAVIGKQSRKARKRRVAVRELIHQMKGEDDDEKRPKNRVA